MCQLGRQAGLQEGDQSSFVLFGPSVDFVVPTHTGGATYLTHFTDSNANPIQKYSHRQTRNNA